MTIDQVDHGHDAFYRQYYHHRRHEKNLRVFMSNINMDGTLEIKKFSFAALNPNKLDAK